MRIFTIGVVDNLCWSEEHTPRPSAAAWRLCHQQLYQTEQGIDLLLKPQEVLSIDLLVPIVAVTKKEINDV